MRDWLAAAGATPPSLEAQGLAFEPLRCCGIGVIMAWTRAA